eukprot:scaffold1042_cov401-Prasinococcus_capsulatus_cf.AAC.20
MYFRAARNLPGKVRAVSAPESIRVDLPADLKGKKNGGKPDCYVLAIVYHVMICPWRGRGHPPVVSPVLSDELNSHLMDSLLQASPPQGLRIRVQQTSSRGLRKTVDGYLRQGRASPTCRFRLPTPKVPSCWRLYHVLP